MPYTPDSQHGHHPGRPRAIPQELFVTVLALYEAGLGYRRIANHRTDQGIGATYSSVRRLVKGEVAYAKSD